MILENIPPPWLRMHLSLKEGDYNNSLQLQHVLGKNIVACKLSFGFICVYYFYLVNGFQSNLTFIFWVVLIMVSTVTTFLSLHQYHNVLIQISNIFFNLCYKPHRKLLTLSLLKFNKVFCFLPIYLFWFPFLLRAQ